MSRRRLCISIAAALSCGFAPTSDAELCFEDGDRVLWLGDSVTAGGRHIAYVDAYLRARWPEKEIHFMNLGLGSETASGLSEPHHPWPRPCVHERIGRVVEKLDFDWAIVSYGINDGIYHPFDELRFTAYTDGITRLVDILNKAGAKVILVSPVPFDAGSVPASKLLPDGGGDYGYKTPYRDYNEVMLKYADWIDDFAGGVATKVNIALPVTEAIAKRRAAEPGFKTGDGVHPNPAGSLLIAKVLLNAFGVPEEKFARGIDLDQLGSGTLPPRQKRIVALAEKRNGLLSVSYREHVGHERPGAPKNPKPLEEALSEAAVIEAEIRKLALQRPQ